MSNFCAAWKAHRWLVSSLSFSAGAFWTDLSIAHHFACSWIFLKVDFNRIIGIDLEIIRAGCWGLTIDDKGFRQRTVGTRRQFAFDIPQIQILFESIPPAFTKPSKI
jgi:hypothetical protein